MRHFRYLMCLAVAALLAGCNGAAPANPPVIRPPIAATAVQYAYDSDPLRVLDVVPPSPTTLGHPVAGHVGIPVLIFVHGGAWTAGSRLTYSPLSQTMANYGLLVFNVDYDLSPAVTVAGEINDVALAESWVFHNATQYGGDPTEVFVMGHSAGGHLVAMSVLDPQWLVAAGASRSQFKGWLSLSGSLNIAGFAPYAPPLWPGPNAGTTLAPLLLPVAGAPPLFASCTTNDASFGCPDRNTIAGNYTAAGLSVTTFLDPNQTHLSQVQVPEANNPNDPLYQAIQTWIFAHL